jgi:hypothetical protein
LGTSLELLRRRIGFKLFKELHTQIHSELFGKSENSNSGKSESGKKGLWEDLNSVLKKVDESNKNLRTLQDEITKDSKVDSKGKNNSDNLSTKSSSAKSRTKNLEIGGSHPHCGKKD